MADTQTPLPAEKGHLQMLFLVALEAVLTTLLKTDQDSRQLLKLLIDQQAVVQVKTHLPAETFYITFSPNGVLLDYKKPDRTISGTVSASFPDLVRAFFSPTPQTLARVRVQGEPLLTRQLSMLMESFNLPNVVKSLLKSFWFGYDHAQTREAAPPKRARELMRKIDDQKQQIEQLTIQSHKQLFKARKTQRHLSAAAILFFLYGLGITFLWWFGSFMH